MNHYDRLLETHTDLRDAKLSDKDAVVWAKEEVVREVEKDVESFIKNMLSDVQDLHEKIDKKFQGAKLEVDEGQDVDYSHLNKAMKVLVEKHLGSDQFSATILKALVYGEGAF